ncbi:MAG: thioredoxin [Gammaproteobacteria bacterium]|nr:MAG: thioredoxin [Gammaproteobacteria bacterium]
MKKILLTLLTLTALNSCVTTNQITKIPVGKMQQVELLNHYEIFSAGYKSYTLSVEQSNIVKAWPENVSIDIYFGTWCHDSQREVPKLLKALQVNSKIKTTLIALDGHKTDPLGLAKNNAVKFTPTFVIFINNQEIGRIVERPKVNLIADIDEIIKLKQ